MSTEMIDWVALCRRTNDPKLMWIEAQLEVHNIPSRRNGFSWHAPILQVPIDEYHNAMAILNQPVGQLDLGMTTSIVIDDIDDEHPYFLEWAMATGRAFGGREASTLLPALDLKDDTFAGLSYEDVDVPEVGPVRMVDVDSRMLSAIGKLDPYDSWIGDPPEGQKRGKQNYLFARFKGSADLYRYENTELAQFLELLRRQRSGESLGGYFDATFKKHPFLYPYERWDEAAGHWVFIDPKARKSRKGKKSATTALPDDKEAVAAEQSVAQSIVEHVNAPVVDSLDLTEGRTPEAEYDDVF